MKIISERKCADMVIENIALYPNAKRIPLYNIWARIRIAITLIFLLLSSGLVISTTIRYKNIIFNFFAFTDSDIFKITFLVVGGFTTILLIIIIMIPIHEFIHALSCPNGMKKSCFEISNNNVLLDTRIIFNKNNTLTNNINIVDPSKTKP